MNAPSRQIYLYWLLLLVPTLVVGGGALLLLKREQARLDERTRAATATRRDAVEARARLIAENVELLVRDVQDALMTTLREVPAVQPDAFLLEWERSNPLVQATFRLDVGGRPVRTTNDATRAWLARWIAAGPPWRDPVRGERSAANALAEEQEVTSNVAQAQRTRNSIQQLAKVKDTAAPALADERSGSVVWRDGANVHLIAWRQLAGSGVVGVELKVSAIAARLGELLPPNVGPDESYALREAGRIVANQRSGDLVKSLSRSGTVTHTAVVPITASVLPGWEVVGTLLNGGENELGGGAFFAMSAMLVGLFVAAILAGGTLLVRQARRSEAEAAQKTSFVANVSHEFKTPLTTIRLYADLLQQGRVRTEEQRSDYLGTIGRETQRLARLVNNVLDFSRLEQGRKQFSLEAIDVGAELTRVLDTQAPRLAEAGLRLERAWPASGLGATADRDAFEQIVLNLVDNACKYGVEGGEVTVLAEPAPDGRGVVVRVGDRGPGVPSAHRAKIFEKFHRVDDTLIAEKSGAGLGLSIARQLARGQGGELRYVDRVGGGAEFILELS